MQTLRWLAESPTLWIKFRTRRLTGLRGREKGIMMEHILVTGGAGYIGVKLVKRLLEEGHAVTLLDNFMYGYEPVLHLLEHDRLDVIKKDIRNGVDDLQQYDVVFHLAGISGLPACEANQTSAQAINVDATARLVRSL